jgi:hypothetical protein
LVLCAGEERSRGSEQRSAVGEIVAKCHALGRTLAGASSESSEGGRPAGLLCRPKSCADLWDIVRFLYGYYKLIFFKFGLIASLSQFPFVALPDHLVFARHLPPPRPRVSGEAGGRSGVGRIYGPTDRIALMNRSGCSNPSPIALALSAFAFHEGARLLVQRLPE